MEDLERIFKHQKDYFDQGNTLSYSFRIKALNNLKNSIKKYENEIITALNQDLGKSEFEAYTNELLVIYLEIKHTLRNLKKWMKSENIFLEIFLQPGSGKIHYEPYGNFYKNHIYNFN